MLRSQLISFAFGPLCFLLAMIGMGERACTAVDAYCEDPSVCSSNDKGAWPHLLFFQNRANGEELDTKEERIETDRHDFTQSTQTVGRGVRQLEFGYTYFYSDAEEEIEQSHTGPEALLRLGLTEHIEFRLRSNYVWEFGGNEAREGSEDLRWAFKLETTEAEGSVPESAVELRFTAPTGGGTWSTKRIEFGLDFIYGWPKGENWELYGSTGFTTNGLGDFSLVAEAPAEDNFIAWSQSIAVGFEVSEQITVYNEVFGIFTDGRELELSLAFYNVGLDYYLTDDIVLDMRVGVGLTSDSEDFFSGIGGGMRF